MADDEFDFEIGDGDFNIDAEDEDYFPPSTAAPPVENQEVEVERIPEEEEAETPIRPAGETQAPDPPETPENAHLGRNSSPQVITTAIASTSESDQFAGAEWNEEMDDDLDSVMSQIDENKVINEAYRNLSQAAVSVNIPLVDNSVNKSQFKSNHAANNGVFKTPTAVTSARGPAISPLKRELNSDMSVFFSSQEDSHQIVPVKRRFPGPAGLLPNISVNDLQTTKDKGELTVVEQSLSGSSKRVGLAEPRWIQSPSRVNINILKRKESEILVSNAPWRSLTSILHLNLKDEDSLLHAMNVAWVKMKAEAFENIPRAVRKIPLLVLVAKGELAAVSSKSKTRKSIKLMDHSGMITAALDNSFVAAYGDKIVPGASLALRNCRSMLYKKSVVVTVSKSNVLCLTTTKALEKEESATPPIISQLPSYNPDENGVYILQKNAWEPEKILQEYKSVIEAMNMIRANDQKEPENVQGIRQPFQVPQIRSSSTLFATVGLNNRNVNNQPEPLRSTAPNANGVKSAFFSSESAQANFAIDSSGFDDDDDEEFLQALEGMDFEIEEDSQ